MQFATWHNEFARCPLCQHATVGHTEPFSINHAEDCPLPMMQRMLPAGLVHDLRLAVMDTGMITRRTPCWKCGAIQPAHYCRPETQARDRLKGWLGSLDKPVETQ